MSYKRNEVYKKAFEYFKGDSLSTDVWINKYALKETNDQIYELTPDDMHNRIASELYRIELKYSNPMDKQLIFDLIKDFKYIVPQGSPMSGIGNNKQIVSLSNCFVIGNEADSYGGIFKVDQEQAQLMKRRGGVGHDLSHIRPKGSTVKNSALTSTGIVPFMDRYSNTTREVAQDGRRGALMLSISIKHPDSEDFINAKLDTTKITGANISVKIDDDFMKSINNDGKYIQQYPIDSDDPKIKKEINSKKLWDKIIYNAWNSAEPGILFWDNIINESVADSYDDLGFKTVSTNPCIIGDTLIATADGRNAVSIKQLTDEGKDVPVYSTNSEGKIEIKWGRNPRLTGEKKEVWKLVMDDGSELIATPDHKIYMKNNTYKELKDLKPGESISSFYSYESNNYRQISQVGSKMIGGRFRNRRQYRLIYEFFNELDTDYSKMSIHHKDFNSKNDNINNLELMGRDEHHRFHSDRMKGDKNPYHKMVDEWKFKFASKPGNKNPKYIDISNDEILKHAKDLFKKEGKFTSRMWVKYAKKHNLPQSLWNEFRFKNFDNFKNQVVDNHKVVSVEFYGYDDVYNITVDDNHNYNIITKTSDDNYITSGGICVKNCGEITLCPYDSCRLTALNLYSYVNNPFDKNAEFDWVKFKEHVRYGQRFMDDIIDLEIEKIDLILEKIKLDPEEESIKNIEIELWEKIKDKAIRGRRTGLGVTAEGDMLASLGYTYGTKDATDFSEKVHKVFAIEAYKSSCLMAKERGSFPIYDYDRETKSNFIKRLRNEDVELDKMLKEYGRRNISLLTIAPTGSVSILTKTTSGIEPVFLTAYKRRRKINPNDKDAKSHFVDDNGDHWEEYTVIHPKFKIWLEKNGYNINEFENLNEIDMNKIIEKSPYFKATSNDVDWHEKIRMQGKIQKWIDHSISVTINLPSDTTENTVNELYKKAWEYGCKGVTVYRDGSRTGVLIKNNDDNKKTINDHLKENNAPKRPKIIECDVVNFVNNKEKWIGFLGMLDEKDGEKYPYELFTGLLESFPIPSYVEKGKIRKIKDKNGKAQYDFIYTDKDGYDITMGGLNRAFNREYWNTSKMLSAMLRHKIHLPTVMNLVDSLQISDNNNEYMFGTWQAGVKRILKKYIKTSKIDDDKCLGCGSTNLMKIEGCVTCQDCGWSQCSS